MAIICLLTDASTPKKQIYQKCSAKQGPLQLNCGTAA